MFISNFFYPKNLRRLNDGRSPGFPLAAPSRPIWNSGKGEAASDTFRLAERIRITVAGTALGFHEIPY
jgi:hypothetical protein